MTPRAHNYRTTSFKSRFADTRERVREVKEAVVQDGAAPTLPSAPAIAPPGGAAPAPEPPIAPAPQAPLSRPRDPLFRFWEQTDLIGIGAAVNNLSRYISHEGLAPPVAIGVFGDWGSGKSFFIRALQSQIALLSSQSRDALRGGRTTVFCSHIVQIEFNAWHFVESNLWASLAAHIFDRLYAELERRSADEGGNSNIDALYQQFSAYKQAVAERERLNKLVGTLTKKREEVEERKQLKERTVKERLSTLAKVVGEQLGTVANEQLTTKERDRLTELLRASNLDDLVAAQAEAAAIVSEGRTFLGRMRMQLTWWGAPQLALFVAAIAVVVFGVPRLVSILLNAQAGNLERLAALVGGYATLATGGLAWLARSGRTLVASAQKVERVLTETRRRVEDTPILRLKRPDAKSPPRNRNWPSSISRLRISAPGSPSSPTMSTRTSSVRVYRRFSKPG